MGVKNQEAKSFQSTVSRDLRLEYLLFTPREAQADPGRRWPLMLFLHGAGERGANLAKVARHGPPLLVRSRPDFPFIVVSPQCPARQTWLDQAEALIALLDEVIASQPVDERRVCLTGLSMGGFGAWKLGLSFPSRFAAVVPICGGAGILPILLPAPGSESALRKLPVWAFHGAKDPIVPVQETEHAAAALRQAGNPSVRVTIYPEAGHDSWTEAYNTPGLYEWLLQQKRPRPPQKR